MRAISFGLCFLLWSGVSVSFGQTPPVSEAPDFRFALLNDQGDSRLPVVNVHTTLHDSEGLVWLATDQGLFKHDGHTTNQVPFYDDNGRSTILDVIGLAQRPNGDLWVTTQHSGVMYVEQGAHHLVQVPVSNLGLPATENPLTRAIKFDRHGHLWVALDFAGLWQINLASLSARQVVNGKTKAGRNEIFSGFYQASDHALYAWTGLGTVYQLTGVGENASARKITAFDSAVQAIAVDNSMRLWVSSEQQGLRVLPPSGGMSEDLREAHPEINHVGRISSIAIQGDRIWLGGKRGITVLDGDLGSAKYIPQAPQQRGGLPAGAVRHIGIDPLGQIAWISTWGGGVAMWSAASLALNPHTLRDDPSALINAFVQYNDSTALIATESSGLFVKQDNRLTLPVSQSGDPSLRPLAALSDKPITALMVDAHANLWIGTRHSWLYRFSDGEVTRIKEGLRNASVTSIHEAPDQTIWVGQYNGGIVYRPAGSTRFRGLDDWQLPATLTPTLRVLDIDSDPSGAIWISTERSGVFRLDPSNQAATQYHQDAPSSLAIPTNVVFQIEATGDSVWLGTYQHAIVQLVLGEDGSVSALRSYGETEGVPSSNIYALTEMTGGAIAAGGDQGLVILSDDVTSFTTNQGLVSNDIAFGALKELADGYLYVGTAGGFNAFDYRKALRSSHESTAVKLSRLLVNQQPRHVAGGSRLEKPIQLDWTEDTLEFEFSARRHAADMGINYQHRLLGIEEQWSRATARSFATYVNLPPGKYQFEARVVAPSSQAANTILRVPLRISHNPAWHPYARAMYVIAGVLLALYLRRLWKRLKFTEDENERVLASDLDTGLSNARHLDDESNALFHQSAVDAQGYLLTVAIRARPSGAHLSELDLGESTAYWSRLAARLGERLSEWVPDPSDRILGRLESNVFLAVYRCKTMQHGLDIVQALGRSLSTDEERDGHMPIKATIGVATKAADAPGGPSELRANALVASTEEPEHESVRIVVYDNDYAEQTKAHRAQYRRLISAIEYDELNVYFLPIRDCNKRIVAVEATPRWFQSERNTKGRWIERDEFYRIASIYSDTRAIDKYITENALRAYSEATGNRAHDTDLVIPITVDALLRSQTLMHMTHEANRLGMRASQVRLLLPVSDPLFLKYKYEVIKQLAELREAGFQIELDDFHLSARTVSLLDLRMSTSVRLQLNRGDVAAHAIDDQYNAAAAAFSAAKKRGLFGTARIEGGEPSDLPHHLLNTLSQIVSPDTDAPRLMEDMISELSHGAAKTLFKRQAETSLNAGALRDVRLSDG